MLPLVSSRPLSKLVLGFSFPPCHVGFVVVRLSDTSLLVAMQPFSLFTERYVWFGVLILILASPQRDTFTYTASGVIAFSLPWLPYYADIMH